MTPDKDELEYNDFLSQLIKRHRLEGAALGVAKQVITQGSASLKGNQASALQSALDEVIVKKCPACHQTIPWSEMFYAMENGTCAACIVK